MKLEYKILWIEDNPTSIRRDKRLVKEYIEDLGFICDIQEINNFSSFEKDIGYVNTSEYDLLLIDLDLGNQETKDEGNTIITNIRDERVYTEIIFYSSQYEELNRKLNEHFVEGIFTSSRNELQDKVQQIIDITIKKTQDVNNLRGLIMAEVAELDRIKEKIIIKATSITSDFDTKEYILQTLKKSYLDNLKQVEKYKEENINSILKKLYVDSDKKARTINKVEKSFNEKEYRNIILAKRNKFAHIEETDGKDENGDACKMIADIPFTAEKCIEIRKEISNYKIILNNILEAI